MTKTVANWVLLKDSVNPVFLGSPSGYRYLTLDLTTKDTTTPVTPESLKGASQFSRELYGISAGTPCAMRIFYFPSFSFPAPARSGFILFLGGLSFSDESFPNEGARGAFAKPSRSLQEGSAKPSRSLQGATTNPSRRFTNPSRRLHVPKVPRRRLGGFTRPPRRVRG